MPQHHSQPSLSIESQRQYYDEKWGESGELTPLMAERRVVILEYLKQITSPGLKVLDLGCGTGWLDPSLADYGTVTAIDLSTEAIRLARARWPHITWLAGNVFEVNLPNNSFDAVVSQEVLEHVNQQQAYIQKAAGCLVAGGHLILTTPNKPVAAIEYQARVQRYGDQALQPLENLIDQHELRGLLAPAFEVVDMRTIVFGYGRRDGRYRWLNSWKLQQLCGRVGLLNALNKRRNTLDLGLHIACLARKRKGPA